METVSGRSSRVAALLEHLGYPVGAGEIPARLGAIAAAGGTVLLAWLEGAAVGLVGGYAFRVLHAAAPAGYITALVGVPGAARVL